MKKLFFLILIFLTLVLLIQNLAGQPKIGFFNFKENEIGVRLHFSFFSLKGWEILGGEIIVPKKIDISFKGIKNPIQKEIDKTISNKVKEKIENYNLSILRELIEKKSQ